MVWVSIMYHCLWCNGTSLVFVIFITLRFLVFWYNLFFIQRKRGSNLVQLKIEVKVYLLVCDWWKFFIVHKFFWQSWHFWHFFKDKYVCFWLNRLCKHFSILFFMNFITSCMESIQHLHDFLSGFPLSGRSEYFFK